MSIPPDQTPDDASLSPQGGTPWDDWKKKSPSPHSETESADPTSFPSESCSIRAFLQFLPPCKDDLPPVWKYPPNDDGRAAFFLEHFGEILRYVPEQEQWRVWFQNHWHDDKSGRVEAYCAHLSRIQQEKAAKVQGDEERKIAQKMATALGDERTIRPLLSSASRMGKIIVPLSLWDADPNVVGLQNGILFPQTMVFRSALPADYITKRCGTHYDPSATCPHFDKFIDQVLPGERAEYVLCLKGYSLTGHMDDQSFYFLYGTGKNGKSIFIETMAQLFGDYAGKAARGLIEESRNGADCKQHLAQLPGIRFLFGEETSQRGRLREDVIKSLVGGDSISAEAKYCAPFCFKSVAKLWIVGNHKPRIEGTDKGIWRRVKVIPFITTISDEDEIPQSILMARLTAELPGILNRILKALQNNPKRPFLVPQSVLEAVEEYRESEDELGDFISATVIDDPTARVGKQELFEAYQRWATASGLRCPLSNRGLTTQLKARPGWILGVGKRCWIGKAFRPEMQQSTELPDL